MKSKISLTAKFKGRAIKKILGAGFVKFNDDDFEIICEDARDVSWIKGVLEVKMNGREYKFTARLDDFRTGHYTSRDRKTQRLAFRIIEEIKKDD